MDFAIVYTRSAKFSLRFTGLRTVNDSSNSWSGHMGRSKFTMTLYRMYPILPSTDVGKSIGSIQLKV